jgi:hypothetical protein|tara:strand:- start:186 stop:584 length:399 start_codon:yes stop_codon:yes gene_type:complete
MKNDTIKVSSESKLQLPLANLVAIIVFVSGAVLGYANLTSRITSLETQDQLMSSDLLKKAEQTPKNLEIFMLLEESFSQIEKLEKNQEMNMSNKIKIEFIEGQLHKALQDIEELKDSNREMHYKNGNGDWPK